MSKKYVVKKVAFLGVVLLILGMYLAIGGVIGYGSTKAFSSIAMMIIGVISASFGYAFVYLFFHINKIGESKKQKHNLHHQMHLGGVQ